MSIIRKIVERYTRDRKPNIDIGPGYLLRWHVIPENRWFNIYLHQFRRSDDDRALHDHPWWNIGLLLIGVYIEHTPKGRFMRRAGNIVCRKGTSKHRIELPIINGGLTYAWSLFITGPHYREWGFWCNKRFVHNEEFLAMDGTSKTNKGCNQ